MRNCKGYFLADLILSISVWMLISMTILPFIIQTIDQSMREKQQFQATIFLYNKLHEILNGNATTDNISIAENGITYKYLFYSENKELCIEYDDRRKGKQRLCEILE